MTEHHRPQRPVPDWALAPIVLALWAAYFYAAYAPAGSPFVYVNF